MHTSTSDRARLRTRWSAIGAAVAVSLGAGGFGLANAAIGSGEKPVTITIEPERILDTRVNLGLAGRFTDATPRELQVTGNVNVAPSGSKVVVPADATGVLVNVTVVLPTSGGFLSLRPSGAAGSPQTSTVNFFANDVVPNSATVDLPANGKIQIWVETASDSGTADVLIDIVGYTVDHTHDDRYYTETEADAVHNAKANAADVYTKTEADAVHNAKANAADVYTKAQVDAAVAASSGVAWASDDPAVPLDTTASLVLSLDIDAPTAGLIAVDAMAAVVFSTAGSTRCWVALDTQAQSNAPTVTQASGTSLWNDARGFSVTAGAHTVNLLCRQNIGSPGDTEIQQRRMTVTFSPNGL